MPLTLGSVGRGGSNLGTTPSQVSLFRHLADPKQVSVDKLKRLKQQVVEQPTAPSGLFNRGGGGGGGRAGSVPPLGRSGGRRRDDDDDDSRAGRGGGGRSVAIEEEEEDEEDHHHTHTRADDTRPSFQEDEEEVEAAGAGVAAVSVAESEREGGAVSTFEKERSFVQHDVALEESHEKQEFLAELKRYRGQTSREFSMEDTLTDIQFEYDRIKSQENAQNVVRIMGLVLQAIVYAIQWGNSKVGPILKLDNGETSWAMETSERVNNREFDTVLEKLYRKHWRKGSMSPEAELAMMLIGSAGVFHFQTHVNEKLSTKPSAKKGEGGGGGSGGGFNLMGLLGPVMGLVSGAGGGKGGGHKEALPPFAPSSSPPVLPPSKKFDFVAGTSTPAVAPAAPAASAAPTASSAPSNQAQLIQMEQQFARRQQEMLDRMDQITRRADEQMRASQARQMDLERQLQQTQMRLHQLQTPHAPQAPHQHQPPHQHRPQLQPQPQLHQQTQNYSRPYYLRSPLLNQQQGPSLQKERPSSPLVEEEEEEEERKAPGSVQGGDDHEEEEVVEKEEKEITVTERYTGRKKRQAPVSLEIDELSISL